MVLSEQLRQSIFADIVIGQQRLSDEVRLAPYEIRIAIDQGCASPALLSTGFGASCEESPGFSYIDFGGAQEIASIQAAYDAAGVDLAILCRVLGFSSMDNLYRQLCLMVKSSDDSYLKQAINYRVSCRAVASAIGL